eukprot:tig00021254_g19680.t1
MASPFVPIQSPSGLLAIPAGTPGSGTPTEGGIRSGRKSTTFALASKVILVLYRLPVIPKKTESGWTFSWDEDALYLTGQGLRRGIQSKAKLVWIGYPNAYIPPAEQAQVKGTLERDFGCVPVFLPDQLVQDHYHGFCKETLWLMLHNMTDFSKPVRRDFNRAHWEAYCKVNQAFAEAIDGHYGRDDIIWIHDYHLLVLPTYVRARQQAAKIGIFLHTPFPTSEVFRTLPVRDEILRGMLNATLVGFHLFDFARHFVSCCTRLLGLQFESRRGGFLGVEYEGRHVMVRVSHVGCDPDRFIQRLDAPDVREATRALADKYHDKRVLLGIDDMDKLKGIPLKLMAFQYLLQNYRSWAGKLVLVQIALPKSARKGETDAVREEVRALVEAINAEFGRPGYTPVEYAERNISFDERVELYSIADVVVNTSIRDGLNLVPYEFVCCSREKSGMLVASEFTGCSRSLSGVILVNPFNSEQVAAAVDKALTMSHEERIAKHEKDYEHIAAHSTMTWADSFLADLDKAAEKVDKLTFLSPGISEAGFRVLEVNERFAPLNVESVVQSYKRSRRRLVLFDYKGTLVPVEELAELSVPTREILLSLEQLCKDPANTVFIVSGHERKILDLWFRSVPSLGIAAEQGMFYRCDSRPPPPPPPPSHPPPSPTLRPPPSPPPPRGLLPCPLPPSTLPCLSPRPTFPYPSPPSEPSTPLPPLPSPPPLSA